MQIPSLPNNIQLPQQPNYNAVKIDIHNPMVNVPATQAPQQYPAAQYEAPTAPIYEYPQAQTQPYYMPPVITTPETQPEVVPPVVTSNGTQPVAQEIPIKPEVVPPAPVVTEQPKADVKKSEPAPETNKKSDAAAEEKSVEIEQPQEIKPKVDLNAFLAKLTNPDYDVQLSSMYDILNMVEKTPEQAGDLLDTKIVDALTNILLADTNNLESTTPEIEAQRDAINANANLSPEDKKAALNQTLTPYEKAERNKSFAIYTSAILQKLYGEEALKMYNAIVPLTEMPGAVTIVEQLKGNPNATVRKSAVEALSYIQNPTYKKDLTTIFTIAQKDQDAGVREAATIALEKLKEVPDEAVAQAA